MIYKLHLYLSIALISCLSTTTALSQGILRRDAFTSMDKGLNAMNAGHHEASDQFFRDALSKFTKVPNNLVYYFGRNSFHLGKYKQSINWLNKYLELKGTTGQHYKKATAYLKQANAAYKKQRESEVGRVAKQLIPSSYYDCPSTHMRCPVCSGSGVLISPGKFGAVYQTCPYSGLSGKLTCDEYNAYLNGELKKKTNY